MVRQYSLAAAPAIIICSPSTSKPRALLINQQSWGTLCDVHDLHARCLQVLSSKLHRLWRRLDKRVFQSLFGGRGSQPPHYFYSVAELNEHTIDGGRERQHMLPVSSIVPGRQFTPIMSESPHSTTLSITTEDFEGAVNRERWLLGASGYWDLPRHPPAAFC
jgi:hypothetical protein